MLLLPTAAIPLAFHTERLGSLRLDREAMSKVSSTFRTNGMFGHITPKMRDLTADTEHARTVFIFKLHGEMIEDLTVFLGIAYLTATYAMSTHGIGALDPIPHVNVMTMLLNNVISGQPCEIIPITNLVLDFRFTRFTRQSGTRTTAPVNAQGKDIADGTIMNAFYRFGVSLFVMPLKSNANFQILFLRFLIRREDLTHAGSVRRERFLHENMFSLPDRFFVMRRTKSRWRREQHYICSCDGVFIGVKTNKLPFLRNINLAGILFLQTLKTAIDLALAHFRHGHQLNFSRVQRLTCRAGAASTATNQSNLDGVVVGSVNSPFQAQRSQNGKPGGTAASCFKKATPGENGIMYFHRMARGFPIDIYFDFEIYLHPSMALQEKNKTNSLPVIPLKTKQDVVAEIEAELLRCVRADQTMSRVELARRLTLAPSTVSIYVDRLIEEGFLLEKEKVERDYGRPPKALGLNPQGGRFIGVDFEARNLMATAIDFSQRPVKQYRDSILSSDSVDTILKKIEKAVAQLIGETKPKVLAIGVGVPGSIDTARGIALHYRHIKGWKDISLGERLSQRFNVPVFLENNIRSMALAELWFGHGRGRQDFICVGVRSGVGAGIVVDGHLYRGTRNIAGEIADWPCPAFNGKDKLVRLEDIVSARALKNGDLKQAAKVLSSVLFQLNLAFNPAKIILAGAMTTIGSDFLNLVQQELKLIADGSEIPVVANSTLGDFNGALGAAALAVHHWKPARR